MPQRYRVDGRASEADPWQKLGWHKSVPDARAAARAFEESGGQARVMGPGGRTINFVASEITPEGIKAVEELIRSNPAGLAPGVTVEDALKLLRGQGPPPGARLGERTNVLSTYT